MPTENSHHSHGTIIAIDGPVAAGKGTIAPALAKRLDGFLLQTGDMYRGVALSCIEIGINYTNQDQVAAILPEVHLVFENNRLFLNGKDVQERIKHEDVSKGASSVAVFPEVREAMVKEQQRIGKEQSEKGRPVIAEGRDIGTRVFPNADLKVFLTARPEVRTKRRLEQIKERGGSVPEFNDLLAEIIARDKRDSEREIDPLVKDPEKHGYFVLDDSDLSEEETVEKIINQLYERGLLT